MTSFVKVALCIVCCFLLGAAPDNRIRVFLIGDSTMAEKNVSDTPECGWGQMFPHYLDPDVVVDNRAMNGRSTKSFMKEGRWNSVLSTLHEGDYVFIQFGHNDAKISDSTRYAAPHAAFRENLVMYVRQAREKGATPVLLTPVNRRKFDSSGAFVDQHGEYPGVVREVAREEKVPLIDLHEKSRDLFVRLGAEGTAGLFLHIPPGFFHAMPGGKKDDTHFTKYGAAVVARLVADGLRELHLPLSEKVRPFNPDTLPGRGKIVALDYFFNCEHRKEDPVMVQFHYVWEDTTNSGFSQLGRVIGLLGADAVAVHGSPTPDSLKKYSVYIIVDPDTPRESPSPNYISQDAINAIVPWVQAGGVLVLMGNDKGTAEFEHLNMLAERFGIRFNEDSYHRVTGTAYEVGRFDTLPPHPIFRDVRQIFVKEYASLTVKDPARPLLTEKGVVAMASARVGKGLVFAIGDPWLYNEYMDTRRLPSEYENKKAGENLFRWLLGQAKTVYGNY